MAIVVVVFGGRRQQTMEDRLHASPQSNDASASASCSTDPANLAGPSPLSRIRTVDHRPRRALPPRTMAGSRSKPKHQGATGQAKEEKKEGGGGGAMEDQGSASAALRPAVNAGGAVTFRRRRLQEGEANG
jgi:hypothetical protein